MIKGMKRFIVLDFWGTCILTLYVKTIDDVENHPDFIKAIKRQAGRLFNIIEIAQVKKYTRA